MLSRFDALNRTILSRTFSMVQNTKLDGEREESTTSSREPQGRIFFISDLHFDHANIIRYCKRPFKSKDEMNEALIKNWNSVVTEQDTVYVLGDIAFGRGHRAIDYWLGKLKGKIIFVRGNHDKGAVRMAEEIPNGYRLVYQGQEFMLMHDPERPANWKGWIIHGDKHNNNLRDFPFFNSKTKMVNVSAEVVNYVPVLLEDIIRQIQNDVNRIEIFNKQNSTHEGFLRGLLKKLFR
jgi:calcineurin-like phosphoesterase family protein